MQTASNFGMIGMIGMMGMPMPLQTHQLNSCNKEESLGQNKKHELL